MLKVPLQCINVFLRTLYCAKGNYEFGISRVIKSLEPYNNKVRLLFVFFYYTDSQTTAHIPENSTQCKQILLVWGNIMF